MLYSLRFVLLSIVLHGVLIYALYHGFTPYESIEPKKKAIKSYLIIEAPKPPPASIPLQTPIDLKEQIALEKSPSVIAPPPEPEPKPKPELQTKPERTKAERDAKILKDEVNTIDISPTLGTDEMDSQSRSLKGASSYIQNLHQIEVERLSENALRQYKEPEAIGKQPSEPNINKELRQSSASYAPKEANIIVLSEFGPNEKTILMDGKCLKVTTTELDDPFWKGPKLWTSGNGCGKFDKFNGQLQKSLDKYLKKER